MRCTVFSSKVGTGEVDTIVRGAAGGCALACGLALGVWPTAWAKAGPVRMMATSSVNGASLGAMLQRIVPLDRHRFGSLPPSATGRRERHNALNFNHVADSTA